MIALEVRLWNTRIGAVAIDEQSGYCTFKYDSQFTQSGIQLSPIMMPLSDSIYEFRSLSLETFGGLPGMIADSLPDKYGNALLNAWLISQNRSPDSANVIERLCYIGTRGMGALEYFPDKYKALKKSEKLDINQLVDISNQILNQKLDVTQLLNNDIQQIIKVGTSAGGARAKVIVAYHPKLNLIKSGQVDCGPGYTYWIMKLDGVNQVDSSSHTRVEYAYYLMAKAAKITMSETKLLKKDGYFHFMTKRFDRIEKNDGKMDKLHMQTLGAILHSDYNEPGTLSYEEAAKVMVRMKLKSSEIKEFYRRMVFNIMSRNQDDHVKNTSFLMNRKGEWSLSPAYDITFYYNPFGQWTSSHQMLINGKRKDFTLDDLLNTAYTMGVSKDEAHHIINDIKQALIEWETYATQADVETATIDFIKNQFIFF